MLLVKYVQFIVDSSQLPDQKMDVKTKFCVKKLNCKRSIKYKQNTDKQKLKHKKYNKNAALIRNKKGLICQRSVPRPHFHRVQNSLLSKNKPIAD